MKMLKIAVILGLLAFGQYANAQTFTNACYVASTGRVWEATGGCGYYILTCNGTDPDNEYAFISSSLGPTCTPCGGGPNGKRVTINILQCDIDDYSIVLVGAAIVLVYFNRKKLK